MRKFLLFLVLIIFISCDDGDVIVTTFDFSDTPLLNCQGEDSYLFFKTNEAETESISLRISINANDDFLRASEVREVILDGSANFVNYRIFNDVVTTDYFCNEVPPVSPEVLIEYFADSGLAELTVVTTFDDGDGVEEAPEDDLDTDGDLLLNFFDFDDDGDNVRTADELDTLDEDGDGDPLTNPKNSDFPLDEIPDYLDDDDDGDGILTIHEDANMDLDPTNDFNDPENPDLPDYLNPNISVDHGIKSYRVHSYTFETDLEVILRNLVLINGEEQITRETLVMGTIINILTDTETVTPVFE